MIIEHRLEIIDVLMLWIQGITSWAKPCILGQYLYMYTGTIPVNKDFGTCIWVQRDTKITSNVII